jgi:hypothetical protein
MASRKKLSRAEVRKRIHGFCGIFKLKPGEKSIVQELLEERRAERAKEDRDWPTPISNLSQRKSKSTD